MGVTLITGVVCAKKAPRPVRAEGIEVCVFVRVEMFFPSWLDDSDLLIREEVGCRTSCKSDVPDKLSIGSEVAILGEVNVSEGAVNCDPAFAVGGKVAVDVCVEQYVIIRGRCA